MTRFYCRRKTSIMPQDTLLVHPQACSGRYLSVPARKGEPGIHLRILEKTTENMLVSEHLLLRPRREGQEN